MKKVRLTESDLIRVIERIVNEHEWDSSKKMPEFKGRLAKAKRNLGWEMAWRDEFDRPSEGPGERSGSIVSYEDFMRFAEDHPDLAAFYFGWDYDMDRAGKHFDLYGGVDVFNPDEDMENLEEMKRKVRVMENKLRRRKQMRRK